MYEFQLTSILGCSLSVEDARNLAKLLEAVLDVTLRSINRDVTDEDRTSIKLIGVKVSALLRGDVVSIMLWSTIRRIVSALRHLLQLVQVMVTESLKCQNGMFEGGMKKRDSQS